MIEDPLIRGVQSSGTVIADGIKQAIATNASGPDVFEALGESFGDDMMRLLAADTDSADSTGGEASKAQDRGHRGEEAVQRNRNDTQADAAAASPCFHTNKTRRPGDGHPKGATVLTDRAARLAP
jgi:hypothetical protein